MSWVTKRIPLRMIDTRAHQVKYTFLDTFAANKRGSLEEGSALITRDHSSKLCLPLPAKTKCQQDEKIANDVYEIIYREPTKETRRRFPGVDFDGMYGEMDEQGRIFRRDPQDPTNANKRVYDERTVRVEYWSLFNNCTNFGDGEALASFAEFSRLLKRHRPFLCENGITLSCDNIKTYVGSLPLLLHVELNDGTVTDVMKVKERFGPGPGHGKFGPDRETGRIKRSFNLAANEGEHWTGAEDAVAYLNDRKPEGNEGSYSYFVITHARGNATRHPIKGKGTKRTRKQKSS